MGPKDTGSSEMREAPPVFGSLAAFFDALRRAGRAALVLDYDGTLAPFTANRLEAWPYPGLPERLEAVRRTPGTEVILVSGRPVSEVARLLGLDPPPEIWGSHGLERRQPGRPVDRMPLPELEERGLERAATWAAGAVDPEHVERKPGSIALHVRGLPEPEGRSLLEEAEVALRPIAAEHALRLCPFDGGLELRAPQATKARAVSALLSELGSEALIAYLGDDLTDEDAFETLAGRGFSVLVRPEKRPTRADVWIRPPDELFQFLDRWKVARTRQEVP